MDISSSLSLRKGLPLSLRDLHNFCNGKTKEITKCKLQFLNFTLHENKIKLDLLTSLDHPPLNALYSEFYGYPLPD